MKNKIFELYKPKSLADFLAFKQENPKENFVYVLQHPPANINILGAFDFGYLVICLPNFGLSWSTDGSQGPKTKTNPNIDKKGPKPKWNPKKSHSRIGTLWGPLWGLHLV